MKVSLNTVKQFTGVDLSVDDLVAKINRQLGGVDEVIDLGVRYKDAIIVRIVTAEQHPNADRLRVCMVDDDGVRADVPRDENGLVQVVCGAPNAAAGMFAVWLPPQATVPSSYDEAELFTLSARELRGVLSQGMLAAGDELGINDDHDGIIEITDADLPHHREELVLAPGLSFAHTFGLDDTIIEIENKMFTHRPDLFGQLGVAREIAGIQHQAFTSPEWYKKILPLGGSGDMKLPLTVANDAPQSVQRFTTVTMAGVNVEKSPLWLQIELFRFGSKSISTVVDVTNYIMLMTAQPVHAYDYDKLRGASLGARHAREGEKVTLLNHKEYALHADDIVIVDGEGPIGLAGIMGGSDSEVSSETKNIALEVATFDMYAVRKTAMRHGVFTDALTRFNKGQSPLQNDIVLSYLQSLMQSIAGGVQAGEVFDGIGEVDVQRLPESIHKVVQVIVGRAFINERLGLALSSQEIKVLLENVEIGVDIDGDTITLYVPYWRTDIEIAEDVVEEVGRLYGFENLPRELPRRTIQAPPVNEYRALVAQIRESLVQAGANEVLTYSFVHENVLTRAGQDPEQAFRVSNALSPDLQYYRLSVLPSLLDKVRMNQKAGHVEFALFEIGKSHSKKSIDRNENLPAELLRIALTYAAKQAKAGAAYYQVKVILEHVTASLGLQLEYKLLPESSTLTLAAPFEAKRCARVVDVASGQAIGIIGEYKKAVIKKFKLPEYSAGFELLTEGIMLAQKQAHATYTPLSRFPSTDRDVCFQVSSEVAYQQIIDAVNDTEMDEGITVSHMPLDIYEPESGETKNITIRFTISATDKTLSGEDATRIESRIVTAVTSKTDATVI